LELSNRTKPSGNRILIVLFFLAFIVGSLFVYVYVINPSPGPKCYTSGFSQDFLRSEIEPGTITEICKVKVNYLGESFNWWSGTTNYSFEFEGFGETSRTMIVSNDQVISFDEDPFTTEFFYSSVLYDRNNDLFSITLRLY
jgi:hypothetical protein